MPRHPDEARKAAEAYLKGERTIVDELGWGTDGWVFSLKPHSVVKVHRTHRSFLQEFNAYTRLREYGVSEVCDCAVPQLREFDGERLIIEMSYVTSPCVLDFGKAYLDVPRDYTQEARDMWVASIEENFGDKAGLALQVYNKLAKDYGVYHEDIRHENYQFD